MRRPRIIVVGAGHLGTYHLRKVAEHPGIELAGVVDVDPGQRERAAEAFAVPAHETFEALQADAAIIATPTSTHEDVACEALRRGWHVLIEKPLASTSQAAGRILAAARRRGCVVQVGHTERFNPAVSVALPLIDRPRYIVAERLGPFSGRSTDVDVVLDLMIHDLDIVASVVAAPLREVRAVGVPIMTQAVDMASARLEFADGTVAQLSAGRASLEATRKLRFFTETRYLSIDCAKREVKSVRRLPPPDGSEWPQICGEPLDVPEGDALALQLADFVEVVQTRRAPRVDGATGLRALTLAEAVKRAMPSPRRATTPPQSELCFAE